MVTTVQVSQIAREVLVDGTPEAQFSQVVREVLMDLGPPSLQVSQLCREVLMSDTPVNVAVVPVKRSFLPQPDDDTVAVAVRRMVHPIAVRYVPPPPHRMARPFSEDEQTVTRQPRTKPIAVHYIPPAHFRAVGADDGVLYRPRARLLPILAVLSIRRPFVYVQT